LDKTIQQDPGFPLKVTKVMRKRIFTWHVHGSYLYYLSQGDFDVYIPVREKAEEGYYGRGETIPFGYNVIEIPAREVRHHEFDVILYQTDTNYLHDQYDILSPKQRKLPRIFLKHDPPWQHPTNEKLAVTDPEIVVVHVTHFNGLMWDNNQLPVRVIGHGVTDTCMRWTGDIPKGIVVINNLPSRGRLLGLDLFNQVRKSVPLEIVGMGAESLGGAEVMQPYLPAYLSRYRFIFNPIRYTSLSLAVCEAMMVGMPVVGLATTELSVIIQNEINGFIHTDIDYLVDKMKMLLENKEEAAKLSKASRKTALKKFNISRFINEWDSLFNEVIQKNKYMAGSLVTRS
jgi:glycosyltransferase involved in cell wall biosynthesis